VELDRVIQNFILVEVSAEGDNDVFSGNAGRKLAVEIDLDDWRNLPPCSFGRPKSCGVRSTGRREMSQRDTSTETKKS